MKQNRSVLFVCMGNICRSPAAEGLLRAFSQGLELPESCIDSAGTHGYHVGNRADSRMRSAAERRGYDLESRARQFVAKDLMEFDLVLAMDRENLTIIKSHVDEQSTAEVKLFSEFLGGQWPTDVPDPYYGGEDGFEYVLDMITDGCQPILDWLTSDHSDE